MFGKTKKIHFVGIGGIGMSGIAELLKNQGFEISGSDKRSSAITDHLKAIGIKVHIGHDPELVKFVDVVVKSSAVNDDNPEVVEALSRKIPVIRRAEMLAEIMRMSYGIGIAGTHGKTTTSSMIATVLFKAGLKPTIIVGGKLSFLGGINAHSGEGDWLVAEADESDGTFLKLTPTISVITNIDTDHLDYYGSFERLKEAFIDFANRVSFHGKVILCSECPNVREILPKVYKRKLTYGFSPENDFYASSVTPVGLGSVFTVFYKERELGRVKLNVPGKHNVLNALAAITASLEVGIPFKEVAEYLELFRNASRRMELKGTVNGVTFVDDYAHHPVEIESSFRALKESFPSRRLVVLFQPHRFSRVSSLWKEFIRVLKGIENLYICDIYPAGEAPIPGVTAERLAKECGAVYCGSLEEACAILSGVLREGDVFLSMGAGDVTKAFELITKKEG